MSKKREDPSKADTKSDPNPSQLPKLLQKDHPKPVQKPKPTKLPKSVKMYPKLSMPHLPITDPQKPEPIIHIHSNPIPASNPQDRKTFDIQNGPPTMIVGPLSDEDQRIDKLVHDLKNIYMKNLLFPFFRGGGSGVSLADVKLDTDIADAISKKHAQNTDTIVGPLSADIDLNDKNLDVKTTNTSSIGETGKALKELFTRIIECDSGDLTIKTPTEKTLVLNQVVYNDFIIPVANGKVPAVNNPTWAVFTDNLKSYTFAIDDYIDLQACECLHDWAEGTTLSLHIHIISNGLNNATARKVKYTLFHSYGNTSGVMTAEDSITTEFNIDANLADKTHLLLTMGTLTMTNYKIGSIIKLRLKRIAGTGTEPAVNPFVEMVGIHYQKDTLGSRQLSTK